MIEASEAARNAIFSCAPLTAGGNHAIADLEVGTPGPMHSMTPTASAGGENGQGGLIWQLPWMMRCAVGQTEV